MNVNDFLKMTRVTKRGNKIPYELVNTNELRIVRDVMVQAGQVVTYNEFPVKGFHLAFGDDQVIHRLGYDIFALLVREVPHRMSNLDLFLIAYAERIFLTKLHAVVPYNLKDIKCPCWTGERGWLTFYDYKAGTWNIFMLNSANISVRTALIQKLHPIMMEHFMVADCPGPCMCQYLTPSVTRISLGEYSTLKVMDMGARQIKGREAVKHMPIGEYNGSGITKLKIHHQTGVPEHLPFFDFNSPYDMFDYCRLIANDISRRENRTYKCECKSGYKPYTFYYNPYSTDWDCFLSPEFPYSHYKILKPYFRKFTIGNCGLIMQGYLGSICPCEMVPDNTPMYASVGYDLYASVMRASYDADVTRDWPPFCYDKNSFNFHVNPKSFKCSMKAARQYGMDTTTVHKQIKYCASRAFQTFLLSVDVSVPLEERFNEYDSESYLFYLRLHGHLDR